MEKETIAVGRWRLERRAPRATPCPVIARAAKDRGRAAAGAAGGGDGRGRSGSSSSPPIRAACSRAVLAKLGGCAQGQKTEASWEGPEQNGAPGPHPVARLTEVESSGPGSRRLVDAQPAQEAQWREDERGGEQRREEGEEEKQMRRQGRNGGLRPP